MLKHSVFKVKNYFSELPTIKIEIIPYKIIALVIYTPILMFHASLKLLYANVPYYKTNHILVIPNHVMSKIA